MSEPWEADLPVSGPPAGALGRVAREAQRRRTRTRIAAGGVAAAAALYAGATGVVLTSPATEVASRPQTVNNRPASPALGRGVTTTTAPVAKRDGGMSDERVALAVALGIAGTGAGAAAVVATRRSRRSS